MTIAALALVLAATALQSRTVPTTVEADMHAVEKAIETWDVAGANQAAARLLAADPESAKVRMLFARIRFLEGRYRESMTELEELRRLPGAGELLGRSEEFTEFVRPLAELASKFTSVESEHFEIHFIDGPDRVLVERAKIVLESSYELFGKQYGIFPEEKIRVEIFPDAETFQLASTLSKREIETSGTIALCKFNRLMMMSPRLVLRGFSWCDTLSHEYVHYVLWRRNGATVPIWLHEGIAKYEEVRWAGGPGSALSPVMKRVLKGALETNEFVTFDEMHPSFAKLKDPKRVSLASAEVLSVVQTVIARGDYELLGTMLDALRDGSGWRSMFEIALDAPFEEFWESWKSEMSDRLVDIEVAEDPEDLVEIVDGDLATTVAEGQGDEEQDPEAPLDAGRFARLGELLLDRGLLRAAAVEYEKAAEMESGRQAVLVLNRLGGTYRQIGELDQAIDAYKRSDEVEPEYAPTLTNLGLAYHAVGDAAMAVTNLESAAQINPYDPRIHQTLADLYGFLGRVPERERAVRELRILQSEQGE